MIENFEERYARLLEDVDEDSCVMIPSIESRGGYLCHSQSIVTSKDDIDCAEDAFVVRYCLQTVSEI